MPNREDREDQASVLHPFIMDQDHDKSRNSILKSVQDGLYKIGLSFSCFV